MAKQYGFYHDTNDCCGCKTCMSACKDKNDMPFGEKYRRVYEYGGGTWNVDANGVTTTNGFFTYFVSVSCNHCADPACLVACPLGAITKQDNGIVVLNSQACDGCGNCVDACPYKIPYISDITKKAHKCDLCRDQVEDGEEPECVRSCPLRCLKFGELESLKNLYGSLDNVAPVPANTGTGPSMIFKRSRFNPSGNLRGYITNPPEEYESKTNTFQLPKK